MTPFPEEMVEAGLLSFEDRPTGKNGHVERAYRPRK
jgi:hypothetical protein